MKNKNSNTMQFIVGAIIFSIFFAAYLVFSPKLPTIPSDGAFVQFHFEKGHLNFPLEVIPSDSLLKKRWLGGFGAKSCVFELLPDVPTTFAINLGGPEGEQITTQSSIGSLRRIRIDATNDKTERKGLRTIISYWSVKLTDEGFQVPTSRRDKPKRFPRRQMSPVK